MTVIEAPEMTYTPTKRELLERAALVIEEHGFAHHRLFTGVFPEDGTDYGWDIAINDSRIDGYCATGAIWRAAYDHGVLPATWTELCDGDPLRRTEDGYARIASAVGLEPEDVYEIYQTNDNHRDPKISTALLRAVATTV